MITVKNEIRTVESEGAALAVLRGKVVADGKAVYVRLAQFSQEMVAINRRLRPLRPDSSIASSTRSMFRSAQVMFA